MKEKITVRIKHVYGNRLIYPVCEKALIFSKMLGTKTLTDSAINYIKQLGYSIEVEAQGL